MLVTALLPVCVNADKEKGPPLAERAGPETKAGYLVYSLVGPKAGCISWYKYNTLPRVRLQWNNTRQRGEISR